jgi:lactate dehydrogenase-like 2-hydroxyacid dehydrogenase
VISVNGVGYDGVDVSAVTEAGIFLANAPVLRDACADMALLLMLAVMRQAPIGQAVTAGSQPSGWDWEVMRGVIGEDPGGKTLGLIGLGRIGQTFAAKAQAAFNMKILYYDPIQSPPNRTTGGTVFDGKPQYFDNSRNTFGNLPPRFLAISTRNGGRFLAGQDAGGEESTPYYELDPPPRWVPFDDLLAQSDVISMHANLNEYSRRMMSAPQFAKMKKGSYFVNMVLDQSRNI